MRTITKYLPLIPPTVYGGGKDSPSKSQTRVIRVIRLTFTDRPDASTANLRAAAYEALMEMVKNSPKDCYVTVQKTVMIVLERLQQVLRMESSVQSHSDRAQYNDLQSQLCATLQVSHTALMNLLLLLTGVHYTLQMVIFNVISSFFRVC